MLCGKTTEFEIKSPVYHHWLKGATTTTRPTPTGALKMKMNNCSMYKWMYIHPSKTHTHTHQYTLLHVYNFSTCYFLSLFARLPTSPSPPLPPPASFFGWINARNSMFWFFFSSIFDDANETICLILFVLPIYPQKDLFSTQFSCRSTQLWELISIIIDIRIYLCIRFLYFTALITLSLELLPVFHFSLLLL